MNFLELKNISEKNMELVNPTSPEKVLKAGQISGLKAGDRVIDFGTGFAEPLILWAERFGISGVGIDLRPYACERGLPALIMLVWAIRYTRVDPDWVHSLVRLLAV